MGGDISAGGAKAVQGIVNFPHNLVQGIAKSAESFAGLPSSDISKKLNIALGNIVPIASTTNFQKVFGVQNPGIVGQTIQNLAQIAPSIVTGGETLPEQIASQGAFGATQSKDPLTGALIGAAAPLAAEGAVSGPSNLIKLAKEGSVKLVKGGVKLAKTLGASAPAKELLDHLGFGKSLEQNNISIASDIKNSYDNVKEEGGRNFDNATRDIGNNPIYEQKPVSGLGEPRELRAQGSEYLNLPQVVRDTGSVALKKESQGFLKNPTISKAHKLQSQMGREVGDLNELRVKSGLTNEQQSDLHNLHVSRTSLRNDLINKIDRDHPQLAGKYQQATDFWRQNVKPYSENGKIRKIAFGITKNPKSTEINSIFTNPEEDINTIRDHIGSDLDKKVLFTFAKKAPRSETPSGLVKSLETASDRGYESYFTPEILKRMSNVKSLATIAPAAKAIAGATLGGFLGHGAGPLGEGIGATAGALAGGRLVGLGEKALPALRKIISPTGKAASKFTSPLLKSARKALLPSLKTAEAALLPSILRGNQ